jgi:hypothetical protein
LPKIFLSRNQIIYGISRGKTPHFEGIMSIPAKPRHKNGFGHKFNLKE